MVHNHYICKECNIKKLNLLPHLNCVSPHVANGDKVGHLWVRSLGGLTLTLPGRTVFFILRQNELIKLFRSLPECNDDANLQEMGILSVTTGEFIPGKVRHKKH
jgi:hypothetical protein